MKIICPHCKKEINFKQPILSDIFRTTIEDLIHFNSDFNKFVNEKGSKELTYNNIDGASFKRSKNEFRIYEVKNWDEKIDPTQYELLSKLVKLFKVSGDLKLSKFDLFIVYGNYPYEKTKICDIVNKVCVEITKQNDFIKFLNYELSFEELCKKYTVKKLNTNPNLHYPYDENIMEY